MLGASGGVKELEGTLGDNTDRDSRVTCVVDYFGPSNMLTIGEFPSNLKHFASDSPESRLIGGAVLEHRDLARQASPVAFVSADDPPFLIAHGDKDMTVPYHQSVELAEALRGAGVDVTLITIEGGGHGFRNQEITRRVHQFFDRHLRGQEVEISKEAIREQ
jgi:dipeptidyl aminopeptidase/acylaminoacyl peptidase